MPGPLFLRGDRVTLHVVDETDLSFVSRWRNDPQVRRWLPRSRSETPTDVESFHDQDDARAGEDVRLLACADDEHVGLVSLFLVEPDSRRTRLLRRVAPQSTRPT